jgi:hypothetical protein
MSVQKRLRERKKAEKAELKRATTQRRSAEAEAERPAGAQVAARSDLEAYGLIQTFSDPPSEP